MNACVLPPETIRPMFTWTKEAHTKDYLWLLFIWHKKSIFHNVSSSSGRRELPFNPDLPPYFIHFTWNRCNMNVLVILILTTGVSNIVWIMDKGRNCAKTWLHWWCKLAVDFPSLNDWAEGRGRGSSNPRLRLTAQAKKSFCGGWERTRLLWRALGRGTNFLRLCVFSLRSISLVGSSAASRPGFYVKSVGSLARLPLQEGILLYQTRRS